MVPHGEHEPAPGGLLEPARLLRAIVETSEDAIVAKDTRGIVVAWNVSAARMFGYTADEALGCHISLIIPEDRRAEEDTIMARLLGGERISRFETVRRTRDGQLLDVELTITPIRNERNAIIGASKIARDITERRRAEAALREEEGRFRTLADHMSQLAWMADRTGWIFWYNRRWFDYTGTTLEYMQGWGWKSVHHPDHLDRVVARIRRSFESGEPWEDTFPLRGRDGTFRWFLSRALPIRDDAGAVVRWLGTNTDITDQRRLEAELAQANERKDTFLATLAHELRNPLGAMRTSVAVMQVSRHDPAVSDRALAVVERQCAHVARLLDDLLDVSRISRDRLELQLADIDLRQVVLDTADVMLPALAAAGVEFGTTMPDGPFPARVDPARVQQMIGNLLANAAKYTPMGGHVHLTLASDEAGAVIRVRDTGIGLAPDMVGPIFDLFVQVPDRHRSQQGLGIGLSLVRRLAELHGGRASATSPGLGHGSTFEVRLPRRPLPPQPLVVAPPAATGAGAGARRVLLVDDDLDNAEAFAMYLRMKGHLAHIARSGEEALVLAADTTPDIVFLDIGLPGIDGYETCRRLRARGSRAVVAALTGWGQDEDRRRTATAGFDRHLVKPVSPETVLALVAAAPRFDRE